MDLFFADTMPHRSAPKPGNSDDFLTNGFSLSQRMEQNNVTQDSDHQTKSTHTAERDPAKQAVSSHNGEVDTCWAGVLQ